jgi:uncharacterized membrane protein YsdA (DUF1294 family)
MDAIHAYLLLINALAFLLMLADKRKAKKKAWRIPESTLLTIAALGGSLGATAGMYLFRHKTRKPHFFIGLPVMVLAHILLLLIL